MELTDDTNWAVLMAMEGATRVGGSVQAIQRPRLFSARTTARRSASSTGSSFPTPGRSSTPARPAPSSVWARGSPSSRMSGLDGHAVRRRGLRPEQLAAAGRRAACSTITTIRRRSSDAVGGKDADGVDFYLAATKVLLNDLLVLDATVRATKANQTGLGVSAATSATAITPSSKARSATSSPAGW